MSDSSSSSGGGEEDDPRQKKISFQQRINKGRREYYFKAEDCGDEDKSWETYDPYVIQVKRELVAREEGKKKRMEEACGGQGQSQDMTTPPGRSGSVPGGKGLEAAGSSKKKKSKTSMESCASSSSTSRPSTLTSLKEKCVQNPVILANLFKVCPFDLLANCRLVCKGWYQDSLVTWRSTSALIVLHRLRTKDEIYLAKTKDVNRERFDHRAPKAEDKDFDAPSKTPLPTFLAYLKQECGTGSKPYRQFHLSNWSFAPPSTSGNSSRDIKTIQGQQDRFWELVGVHMTFLKLSKCTFQDASVFRKIIFQTCPNLQTLILYNCSSPVDLDTPEKLTLTQYQTPVYGEQKKLKSLSVSQDKDYQEPGLPISYLELLSHFPALTTLNLMYGALLNYNKTDDLSLWVNAIKVIKQRDKNKLALRSFSVAPGFQLGHSMDPDRTEFRQMCNLFEEVNLHSELLDVKLHCDVAEALKVVLTQSGKTIRKISAVRDSEAGQVGGRLGERSIPSSTDFPCYFPFGVELDNLVELTISPIFCGDMEFMKWTPNLEKLQIVRNDHDWGLHGASPEGPEQMTVNSSEAIMGEVKLLKLKELWMGYRLYDVDEARRFCGWMPNLEVATLFLDDEQFGVICENWKSLKHLHVLGSRLGDKGITGIGFKGKGGSSGRGVVKPRPNITLLQDLTCFQFAIFDSKLSDSSINNGFLKLPNLQTLGIASYMSTIGEEAMKAIHEKVPNCQIKGRRYGPQSRERNITCRYFPKY